MSDYILLSIIIPVYNVENFIEECILSITNQIGNFDHIKIIIVNDGTKDDSIAIVKDILLNLNPKIQRNFIIIEQENKGLSSARNMGLNYIAKTNSSRYVYFLDSDDYLSFDFFEKIIPIISENDIDILDFNANFIVNNISTPRINNRKNGLILINSELERVKYFGRQDWAVWYRVINIRLLRNFQFPDGYLYEDIMTIPFLYQKANIVYSLSNKLINYRINQNGIMSSKNPKYWESIQYATNLLVKNEYNSPYMRIIHFRFKIAAFFIILKNSNLKATLPWIYKIKDHLSKEDIQLVNSIKLKLIYLCPPLLYFYYLVLQRKK